MRVNPFRPVNLSRGAPMGRRDGTKNLDPDKRICARWGYGIGGYDTGGAYWGTPQNIWAVWNAGDPDTIRYVRANSRQHALRIALKQENEEAGV